MALVTQLNGSVLYDESDSPAIYRSTCLTLVCNDGPGPPVVRPPGTKDKRAFK